VDFVTPFSQYYYTGYTQNIYNPTSISYLTNRYTSVYANASYTYDNRFILTGSARKDESNLFGVNSNQKGVPLWSVGGAWNIDKESFYKLDWLPYLKLRLTYGFNGNSSSNLTAVASLLQVSGNANSQPYAIVKTYPNPNLSWEKVAVTNLAIDFATKDNRVSGSVDYYKKQGTDLIGKQPIDPTVGIQNGVITRNVANLVSHGVDIQLISKNLDNLFKWQTSFLFSFNKDKLTAYQNLTGNGSSLVNSGISVSPVIGQPVYNIISYKWIGLDPQTGDPMGYVNGQPSKDYATITSKTPISDLVFSGSALPTYFGALSNTFSYKQFSLYVNITYRLGYYFRKSSINYNGLYNSGGLGNSDFAERWQKPGDELHTYVPSMPSIADAGSLRDQFYLNSSALVGNAGNIRLQNVNLSYRFDTSKLRIIKLSDLQFYIYSNNLQGYIIPSYNLSFGIKAKF